MTEEGREGLILVPTLLLETTIDAPIERCFALSLSIDAHSESMSESSERAIAGTTTGQIGPGETVTWRARHFGIPFTLTSQITAYEQPTRFVDEQTRGPFKRWWHEHRFVERDGATMMTDRIEFAAPFGPLGRIAARLVLTRYMGRMIAKRNAWLKRELEGEQARE